MEQIRTVWQQHDQLCQQLGHAPVCQAAGGLLSAERDDSKRQLAFILSVSGINRNNWDLVQEGWHLDTFRANPRVFWAHDDVGLPIATSQKEWLASAPSLGKHLRGVAEFINQDLNDWADKIYRLYLAGHLAAVSVRWRGLKFEEITDEEFQQKGLPVPPWFRSGVRFVESELYEYSAVGLPGEPRALMLACQQGIISDKEIERFSMNTPKMLRCGDEPVFSLSMAVPKIVEVPMMVDMGEKKTTASEPEPEAKAIPFSIHGKCPMADRAMAWDSGAAKQRLQKWASSDGSGSKDKMDWKKYEQAFAYVDQDNKENFAAYKFGHHDIVDGKFNSIPRGVFAAAQRIQQGKADVPIGDVPGIKRHIEEEYDMLGEKAPWKRASGVAYGNMCDVLRECSDESELGSLREIEVKLAEETYGPERLREEWEPRKVPPGPTAMWASIAKTLGGVVSEVVVDPEEADARINTLMAEIADAVCPILSVGAWAESALKDIAQGLGIDIPYIDEDSNAEALAGVITRIEQMETKAVEVPEQPKPAETPVVDTELEDKFTRIQSKMKCLTYEDKEEKKILSLFERLKQVSPHAGSA